MLFLLAIFWIGAVGVLMLRAVTQYRHYEMLPSRAWPANGEAPPISVIIPARNEAQNIGRCLESLLAQDYPSFETIVVDDNSTDNTAGVVRSFQFDARVRLVSSPPLPEGWTGKSHACWQGALAATGQWLCFIDADTISSPTLLSTAAQAMNGRQLDLLSLEPFQDLGTFWERLIIPAGFFLLAFYHDLRQVNKPNSPTAAANGQFILVRRNAYDAICGHAAVRSEICEDSALARLMKRSGKHIALLGAETLIHTRMYIGIKPLWEGLSKNVVEMVGGLRSTVLVALSAMAISCAAIFFPALAVQAFYATSVIAPADLAICGAAMAALILYATHVGGARHFNVPWWHGLLFPLGYAAGALIAFNSVLARLRGRVLWKGRVFHPQKLWPPRSHRHEQRA